MHLFDKPVIFYLFQLKSETEFQIHINVEIQSHFQFVANILRTGPKTIYDEE